MNSKTNWWPIVLFILLAVAIFVGHMMFWFAVLTLSLEILSGRWP